ncbi:M16 family metallopeptidase [Neogemmobacter tilapiae]|uniref:Peptidase M16 n=1 Tax=Neogemmobacter tilapiae TaxID=875041 RepID=A0A918TUN1_9RHOB|nr:pitrilysin family protein [Gemmobacter tilapiae]GHC64292.1 peptidase M16 [Gemmobacter tilapiae]
MRALLTGLFMALLSLPLRAEDVTAFTLKNGLQVVVIEDHRAPVVTQMIWYRAGSADEKAGKSGIAHFLEHLMFKGTDKLASGEFSETVERQGGDDNAFTSWDYTAYFQRVAADRLDQMMMMEANRMTGLQLLEEEVLTERQVILEERSQRIDSDPGAVLQEQVRAALFQNHRYGIPIIGWRHEMEGLSQADALDWYKLHYAPNNATLVIAGDVTPDQVKALAEQYYGPLEPNPAIPARVRVKEPPQMAERRLTLSDSRISEQSLTRQYLVPARKSGDQKQAAALLYLAELLGGNPTTSILARDMQFGAQPKAIWTSAWYGGTEMDYGTFGVALYPAPGVELAVVEARLDALLADIAEKGVDPEAFERIKTQLRAGEIFARDNSDGLARMYGEALTIGLTLEDIKVWPQVLQEVTPADVQAAALLLDRKQSVTAMALPEENAE